MKKNNVTIYVGTDELLDELRELGYKKSIELEDLIDLIDEDPAYMEQLRPTLLCLDELNFVSSALAELQYNRRPT